MDSGRIDALLLDVVLLTCGIFFVDQGSFMYCEINNSSEYSPFFFSFLQIHIWKVFKLYGTTGASVQSFSKEKGYHGHLKE